MMKINVDNILPDRNTSPFLTFINHLSNQRSAVSEEQTKIAQAFIQNTTSIKNLVFFKKTVDEWATNVKMSTATKKAGQDLQPLIEQQLIDLQNRSATKPSA